MSPAPPAPPPAALQAERGRSAWRAPAIPPFPRHLVPELAPSQRGAALDKARPGPAGAPAAHPGWAAWGLPGPRPRPAPPGGPAHPLPRGAPRATATRLAPEGQRGPPHRLPGWTRAFAAAHPCCGKGGPPQAGLVTRAGYSCSLESLLSSGWVGWEITNSGAPTYP